MGKVMRGFYIRTERVGNKTDLTHAWAEAGTLPQEWDATKQDASVTGAQIFSSTQRNRQHNNRRILDSYNA